MAGVGYRNKGKICRINTFWYANGILIQIILETICKANFIFILMEEQELART